MGSGRPHEPQRRDSLWRRQRLRATRGLRHHHGLPTSCPLASPNGGARNHGAHWRLLEGKARPLQWKRRIRGDRNSCLAGRSYTSLIAQKPAHHRHTHLDADNRHDRHVFFRMVAPSLRFVGPVCEHVAPCTCMCSAAPSENQISSCGQSFGLSSKSGANDERTSWPPRYTHNCWALGLSTRLTGGSHGNVRNPKRGPSEFRAPRRALYKARIWEKFGIGAHVRAKVDGLVLLRLSSILPLSTACMLLRSGVGLCALGSGPSRRRTFPHVHLSGRNTSPIMRCATSWSVATIASIASMSVAKTQVVCPRE